MHEHTHVMPDGTVLHGYRFEPNHPVKAVVNIIHGAGEHALRYTHLAQFLTQNGFAVQAFDHRGHGKNRQKNPYIHMGDTTTADDLVHDALALITIAKAWHPEVPCLALAHSMGSFVMRSLLNQRPDATDGTLIIGSSVFSAPLIGGACILARFIRRLYGARHISKVLTRLTQDRPFRAMAKRGLIETRDEWVTRDETIRQTAAHDPDIGQPFTITSQIVLMSLMLKAQKTRHLPTKAIIAPMVFMCGDEDPVCDFGDGLTKLKTLYTRLCLHPPITKCYLGLRHEIINEIERAHVFDDMLDYLNMCIEKAPNY